MRKASQFERPKWFKPENYRKTKEMNDEQWLRQLAIRLSVRTVTPSQNFLLPHLQNPATEQNTPYLWERFKKITNYHIRLPHFLW